MPTKTITLPKDEYLKLKKQAKAYQALAGHFFTARINEAESAEAVVADFRKTNLYSNGFLEDLKDGLKHSSYFKTK